MISNHSIPLLMVALAAILSGCTEQSEDPQTSLPPEVETNSEVRHYLETNSQARHFLERFMPEIERNRQVGIAIKAAVAANRDVKVKAFHEFLSHWDLQWPVVKEGAVGEGGIGFAWHKSLQRFQGTADATALIEDRYTLQAILDWEMSKDFRDVTFTRLRFHFTEVKSIWVPPEGVQEGGARVIYQTSSDRWFGLKEWDRLKTSNWNFSSIGINIISNAPVPNIHKVFD